MSDECSRITGYLMGGGLFNPEMMEHGEVRDLLLDCRTRIKQQEADIKFLLSFAPDEPSPGLDPTFYHTLTHDGDMELSERIKNIRLRSK